MMQQLMQDLVNWISASKGTIIGVVGIVLAVVFYRKGKEKKEFSYSLRSSTLIRGKKRKLEKLSVTYAGQQIDDLCVSKFTIWNSGNKTLNRDDMVTSKELTIAATDESRILDAELIACSEETNKFSVQIIDKHTAKVLFDYVDKREGAVVQILHTGTNDTLKIDCKIKGGLPIKNFVNETVPRIVSEASIKTMSSKKLAIVSFVMMLILLGFAIAATGAVFNENWRHFMYDTEGTIISKDVEVILTPIIVWPYVLLCWMLMIPTLKMKLKIGMPHSLREHSVFDT